MKTDYKPLDIVKITGNNVGFYGGGINDRDVGDLGFIFNREEGAVGSFSLMPSVTRYGYTMHRSQFVLVARRDRAGKYRDVNGRFYKLNLNANQREALGKAQKYAAVIDRVKPVPKEVKKEAPKAAPVKAEQLALMRQRLKEYDYHSCCSFVILMKNVGIVPHIHAPCHASLRQHGGEALALVEGLAMHVKHLKDIGEDVEHYKRAVEWCLNDSHFASAFITKDVEEALTEGVVCDVNTPNNQLFTSLVALRTFSEYKAKARTWCEMVDAGVDKMVAWAASDFMTISKDKTYYRLSPTGNAHRVFGSYSTSREQLRRFIKESTWIRPGAPYSLEASYDGAEVPTFGGGHPAVSLYDWAKATKYSISKKEGRFGNSVYGVLSENIVEFCNDMME